MAKRELPEKPKVEVLDAVMSSPTSNIRITSEEFPSNSKKSREAPKRPSGSKVIQGGVVQKKKTLGKRFAETFLGSDPGESANYTFYDIVIPAIKNMVFDGIEIFLFGETRGRRVDRGRSGHRAYDRISYRDDGRRNERPPWSAPSRGGGRHEDVEVETRSDAEAVLNRLADLIDEYGEATVADLNAAVGRRGDFTDHKYGWTNISSARPVRTRDGYLIDLPRPIVLN